MRRAWRGAAAVLLSAVVSLGFTPALTSPAAAEVVGVTKSVQAERVHLIDGQNQVVDKRSVTVKVDNTTGLRDRQSINVSWTGARPTGGVVLDPNASRASRQEFPVVLIQCRGTETDGLRRENCFTQSAQERFSGGTSTPFPAWRLDRHAPPEERERYVGVPAQRPATCLTPELAERWLPFVAADGTTYAGGPQTCAQQPPEAVEVEDGSLSLPNNTTYAESLPDGSGSSRFNVRTAENNASLGCTEKVACSLVVIPILGISCDAQASQLAADQRPEDAETAAAAAADCTADGRYLPGTRVDNGTPPDVAVTGGLWWSESNWRHRLTIPLSFAPAANLCDIVGAEGVDLYGSELLVPATQQWAPTFCLDAKRIPFKHVQTGEPQARNLVKTGTIDAALTSLAPEGGYGSPVVSAPLAVSGFAIGFTIDDGQKREMRRLNLTPRLIAKLLTQSYSVSSTIRREYEALSANPLNITQDPEFRALNPDAPTSSPHVGAATLLNLSSGSDVVSALTAYINADPEARSWLDGQPDPWAMVVNPNYKNIELPVDTWELRDTFVARPAAGNRCLELVPVPYLPLVAAPVTRLSLISQAMQFSIATSQIACEDAGPLQPVPPRSVAVGRQPKGGRFMLGVMSLGDAARYQVDTAALQTSAPANVTARFTTAEGRRFVEPTTDALKATARAFVPDETSGIWQVPYAELVRTAADGYPGTMVTYAAVPTQGLAKEEAAGYAALVRYAAGPGQIVGTQQGQLPQGFLAMTAANGLGPLASFSLRAADAIEAQAGVVPTLISLAGTDTTTTGGVAAGGGRGPDQETPSGSDFGADDDSAAGQTSDDSTGDATFDSSGDGSLTGSGSGAGPGGGQVPPTVAANQIAAPRGLTTGVIAGLAGAALPLVLLGGILAVGVGVALQRRSRPGLVR